MTRTEAARVLAAIAAAYPNVTVEGDTAEVWYGSVLAELELDAGFVAARYIIQNDIWFPTPARFNEIIRSLKRAEEPLGLPATTDEPVSCSEAQTFLSGIRERLRKVKP